MGYRFLDISSRRQSVELSSEYVTIESGTLRFNQLPPPFISATSKVLGSTGGWVDPPAGMDSEGLTQAQVLARSLKC